MSIQESARRDLSTRFRRSEGRGGRTFAATVKVAETELAELEKASTGEQKAVSEWAREVLLREARKGDCDPLFTEIVATRMLLNLVLKHIACGERLTSEMYSAVLSTVRTTKHKQAIELMQQYTSADEKES
jgi:hypothetical protein